MTRGGPGGSPEQGQGRLFAEVDVVEQRFADGGMGAPGPVHGQALRADGVQARNDGQESPGGQARVLQGDLEDLRIRVPQGGEDLVRLGGLVGHEDPLLQGDPPALGLHS